MKLLGRLKNADRTNMLELQRLQMEPIPAADDDNANYDLN